MIQVKLGDRVTIMKGGTFKTTSGEITVKSGYRARVLDLRARSSKKKIWAEVELFGVKGNAIGRICVPGWWLEPRTILDDLAEV
jgi:hypothetical protein